MRPSFQETIRNIIKESRVGIEAWERYGFKLKAFSAEVGVDEVGQGPFCAGRSDVSKVRKNCSRGFVRRFIDKCFWVRV